MEELPVPQVSRRVEEGLIELQRVNARNHCRKEAEE